MHTFDTNEVTLAREIAETLNDQGSITHFLTFCRNYKESFLRDMLARAMATPQRKIKKTRGALFTYLVNLYGEEHARS